MNSIVARVIALMVIGASLLEAQSVCGRSTRPYGDIGVGLYQCVRADCLVAGRNRLGSVHVFNVEPSLWHISAPAAGLLKDGDVLLAIDGHPITTPAGGARLAIIRPDEHATLLVRRDGIERVVHLTAVPSCEHPSIQITNSDGGPPAEVSRKELAELNARLGAGGALEFSALPLGVVGRSGAIGTIQRASPAELAGLRRGDVIVSIDVLTPPGPPGRGSRTFIITVRRADRLLTLRAIQPPSSTR